MGQKIEETALDASVNIQTEGQKKSKKHKSEAKHQRKLEGADPEVGTEDKKEKKKKKKEKREKREHSLNSESVLDSAELAETINESGEVSEVKKKRKNHKREKETQDLDGSNGTTKEKKKRKKEAEVNNLSSGLVPGHTKAKKIPNGSSPNCADGIKNCVTVDGEERQSYGGVAVSGKDTKGSKFTALKSFAESGLPKEVLECCKNFNRPSPIQSHSWPFLLDGRDFIGIAATGSGKTLGFGVPAIMHVLQKRKHKTSKKVNPTCLVLSPTRELAQQISDVLSDAGLPCGLQSVCLYGGTSKGPQISALKSGVDIVIGTPGRLKDLIEMGVCNLKEASFVVLDEADRMLDMGFEPEVRAIKPYLLYSPNGYV
ncbi:RNA helicase [Bertholletia excelsa]